MEPGQVPRLAGRWLRHWLEQIGFQVNNFEKKVMNDCIYKGEYMSLKFHIFITEQLLKESC
jgi:hypothetical protein